MITGSFSTKMYNSWKIMSFAHHSNNFELKWKNSTVHISFHANRQRPCNVSFMYDFVFLLFDTKVLKFGEIHCPKPTVLHLAWRSEVKKTKYTCTFATHAYLNLKDETSCVLNYTAFVLQYFSDMTIFKMSTRFLVNYVTIPLSCD